MTTKKHGIFESLEQKNLLQASDLIKKCHRIHCNLISAQAVNGIHE